jgi:hypothetical protein
MERGGLCGGLRGGLPATSSICYARMSRARTRRMRAARRRAARANCWQRSAAPARECLDDSPARASVRCSGIGRAHTPRAVPAPPTPSVAAPPTPTPMPPRQTRRTRLPRKPPFRPGRSPPPPRCRWRLQLGRQERRGRRRGRQRGAHGPGRRRRACNNSSADGVGACARAVAGAVEGVSGCAGAEAADSPE